MKSLAISPAGKLNNNDINDHYVESKHDEDKIEPAVRYNEQRQSVYDSEEKWAKMRTFSLPAEVANDVRVGEASTRSLQKQQTF